jgi:heme exporter protein B
MVLLKEIATLIQKDIRIEWRQKFALGGILLYVVSTVFVVYISFIRVQPPVWNVLYWIIMLFASVNAVTKSFVQENGNRQLYYYQLSNPTAMIIAKIIYNVLLLLVLNILTFIVFGFVAGNPVKDMWQFGTAILLSSLGFGITFTFISGIAAKANNSATLMAILSFPVVLPILLELIKLSANALGLITDTAVMKDIMILVAIDLVLLSLALLLFPYLWRD